VADKQAMNNMRGEAAARRHALALLEEWEAAATYAHGGQAFTTPLLVTARLIEAGDKLANALSEYALGESLPDKDEGTAADMPRPKPDQFGSTGKEDNPGEPQSVRDAYDKLADKSGGNRDGN
jgi:hypothetical protein